MPRSGILKCFDLQMSDFASQEDAIACADHFVAQQRADWPPELISKFPDQLCEGCPFADLFWFSNYKGMPGHPYCICLQGTPLADLGVVVGS